MVVKASAPSKAPGTSVRPRPGIGRWPGTRTPRGSSRGPYRLSAKRTARRLAGLVAQWVPAPCTSAAVWAVFVPALVMLGLGLWGLDRGSMWRDEGVTFEVAQRSLPEMWRLLHHVDMVHALYYLLMHLLLSVHPGEIMLRLPSVAAATATAAAVAAIGTRLARPRVGLWAGLLYAATPLTGYYAQEGRSYALVAAGAALSTLLLVRAVNRPRPRVLDWYAYAAVVAVTTVLHAMAVLVLFAHAATLVVSRVPRAVWRGFVCALGAAALVLVPFAYVSHTQIAQLEWLTAPGAREADLLVRAFAGPSRVVLFLQLVLVSVALRAPLERARRLSLNTVALPLMVLPPLVLFAVSDYYRPLYDLRYVLFALSGAPLLVAGGAERVVLSLGRLRSLARMPRRAVTALFGIGLAGLGFWWQLPVHQADRTAASRPDDLGAVARVAAREVRPGDAVLFLPSIGRRTELVYPDSFRGTYDVALAKSAANSDTLYGREVGADELRGRLIKLNRVWVLSERWASDRNWSPTDKTERAKLAAIGQEFVQLKQIRQSGVTLALYVRRPWQRPGLYGDEGLPVGPGGVQPPVDGPGMQVPPIDGAPGAEWSPQDGAGVGAGGAPAGGSGVQPPPAGGYGGALSDSGSGPYVPPGSRYQGGEQAGGYAPQAPQVPGPQGAVPGMPGVPGVPEQGAPQQGAPQQGAPQLGAPQQEAPPAGQ
ncbi:glycosyltransferase family 39 protein [Streptomyces sp. NPDC002004]